MRGDVRIGISGWLYKPWRGVFYPPGLSQKRELEYASRQFNSIEVNGSFYSLKTPKAYRAWYEATPSGFLFAIKGGRYITHMRRLRDVEKPLANFIASGLLRLEEKLGPILWQFPENVRFNPEKFEAFLGMLPRTTDAAAELASRHDRFLKGRVWTKAPAKNRRLRHAFEIRHESFLVPQFIALLRKHNAAFVVADTAGKFVYAEDVTADFVYLRLHGSKELYFSGYEEEELKKWAAAIRAWSTGRQPEVGIRISDRPPPKRKAHDVYVYFDNDAKIHAPFNAMRLMRMLEVPPPEGNDHPAYWRRREKMLEHTQ